MKDLVKTARRAAGSAVLPTVSFGVMNAEVLILKMADTIEQLQQACDEWAEVSQNNYQRAKAAEERIEILQKGLEIFERERDRYKYNQPEITGAYFLAGGHGSTDDNMLPDFVRIVPAYGCAWEQVYAKTDKTISYEGS